MYEFLSYGQVCVFSGHSDLWPPNSNQSASKRLCQIWRNSFKASLRCHVHKRMGQMSGHSDLDLWPSATKLLWVHHWVQVDICTRFEEIEIAWLTIVTLCFLVSLRGIYRNYNCFRVQLHVCWQRPEREPSRTLSDILIIPKVRTKIHSEAFFYYYGPRL